MSTLSQRVGARIREIREGKGLTQSDIGDQRRVSAVERGKNDLLLSTVEEFAARLKVQPVSLLGGFTDAQVEATAFCARLSAEEKVEALRSALRDLRKEVRSSYAKQRIENALKETKR